MNSSVLPICVAATTMGPDRDISSIDPKPDGAGSADAAVTRAISRGGFMFSGFAVRRRHVDDVGEGGHDADLRLAALGLEVFLALLP